VAAGVALRCRTGELVRLRPGGPDDREALLAGLERLSFRSLTLRFHSGGRPPPAVIDHLLDVDGHRHVAWAAILPDAGVGEGLPVGAAHWFRDDDEPTRAEIAITVVDEHQRKGIGTLLLDALAVSAGDRGIAELTAEVRADNVASLALLRGLPGIELDRPVDDPGIVEVVVPVPESARWWVSEAEAAALRAAAAEAWPL
jgi:RimJ/RimL family protein N-acetyltransferase